MAPSRSELPSLGWGTAIGRGDDEVIENPRLLGGMVPVLGVGSVNSAAPIPETLRLGVDG
jgi:hypothetical protein